jgi:hypothetical protein
MASGGKSPDSSVLLLLLRKEKVSMAPAQVMRVRIPVRPPSVRGAQSRTTHATATDYEPTTRVASKALVS